MAGPTTGPTTRPKISARTAKAAVPAETKIAKSKQNNSVGIYQYPSVLPQQRLMMGFIGYQFQNTRSGLINTIANTNGAIVFPLPEKLGDQQTISNQMTELGMIGGAIAESFGGGSFDLKQLVEGAGGFAQELGGEAGRMLQGIFGGAANAGSFAQWLQLAIRSGLTNVFPSAGKAVDVIAGTAVNPHATVTFDGVPLKTHTLTWKFAPTNKADADTLAKIINELKRHSLPSFQNVVENATIFNRALLTYPDLVDIKLFGLAENHYFKFKRCMITNISVDYTPSGLAINTGGTPTIVTLQISLVETDIHTSADYGGQGAQRVGLDPIQFYWPDRPENYWAG